jgi:glyoxylase-like metal-dependent hydrolase (beta-lactamase superfamily II)
VAKLDVFEVVPGIWCVRRGKDSSASYIVKMSPGAVLVDAGSDPTGVEVMKGLQAARVGLNAVRAILLSHAHPHAAAGARALRARSGARVLCSRLEAGAPEPDGFLEPSDRVEGRFQALPTPGHTEGHTSFLLLPGRVLFSGDALSIEGANLVAPRQAVSPEAARESAARCLALEPELVLPGHGGPIAGTALSVPHGHPGRPGR